MSIALLKKLQEELRDGQLCEISEIVELKVAMQEFIKHKLQEGVSYHTARTYLNDLIDFARYCVSSGEYVSRGRILPVPLTDISREMLMSYFAPGELSPHTVFKKWRTLRVFFRWLYSESIIRINTMEKIKAPRVQETFPSVWTVDQVDRFLATFDKANILDHRNYAIVVTLLDTAARVGEITGIRDDDDIDWDRRIIKVAGKTGSRVRI